MGNTLFDQYSLLHFSVGVVAYFWSVSFSMIMIIHILFETIENTQCGMNFINTYIPFWPGGKTHADSCLNRVGDTVFSGLGWIVANIQM
jgi:hypothetical protein